MGSGHGRLRDKNADGCGDASGTTHTRKFQSYHLPFQKKKKFAKLKARLFGKNKSKADGSKTNANFFVGQESLNKSSGVSGSLQVLSSSKGPRPNVLSAAHSQHVFVRSSYSPKILHSDLELDEVLSETTVLPMPSPELHRVHESDALDRLPIEIALFKKNEDPYSIVLKDRRKMSDVALAAKRESSSDNSIFEDATEGDLPRKSSSTDSDTRPGESSRVPLSGDLAFEDAADFDGGMVERPDEASDGPADKPSSEEHLTSDLLFEDATDDIVDVRGKQDLKPEDGRRLESPVVKQEDVRRQNSPIVKRDVSRHDSPIVKRGDVRRLASPAIGEDVKRQDSPTIKPAEDILLLTDQKSKMSEVVSLPVEAEEESSDSFCDLNGSDVPFNESVNLPEKTSSLMSDIANNKPNNESSAVGSVIDKDLAKSEDARRYQLAKLPEVVVVVSKAPPSLQEVAIVSDNIPPKLPEVVFVHDNIPPKLPEVVFVHDNIPPKLPEVVFVSDNIPPKLPEVYTRDSHSPGSNNSDSPPRFTLPKGRRPRSDYSRVVRKPRQSDSSDERSGSVGDDGRATYSSGSDVASDPSSAHKGKVLKEQYLVEDIADLSDNSKGRQVVLLPVAADMPAEDSTVISGDVIDLSTSGNPPRDDVAEVFGITGIALTAKDKFVTEQPKLDTETAQCSATADNGIQKTDKDVRTSDKDAPLFDVRLRKDLLGISPEVDVTGQRQILRLSGNYGGSDSSSGELKASVSMASSEGSGSEIDDDVWDEDYQNDKSAESIKTKLVLDLLKKLEVDMGDFQTFAELTGVLEDKYHVLPLTEFLTVNLESKFNLDDLSRCLRVLAKYGINLLKARDSDEQHWRKVIIPPKMIVGHWLSVKGSKDILMALGYEESDRDLVFPEGEDPNVETTAAWVVEMLLAAHEINLYCIGLHPQPDMFKRVVETQDSGAGEQEVDHATEEPSSVHGPSGEDHEEHPVDKLETRKEEAEEEVGGAAAFFTPCVPEDEDSDNQPLSAAKEEVLEEGTEPPKNPVEESEEMFGRRTVVPWLMDKEKRLPEAPPQPRCHLCGSSSPAVRCEKCSNLIFCVSCDDMYHRHPKRRDHTRKPVNAVIAAASMPPPLPPPRPPSKITDPNKIPVPPPRRRKSQRSIPNSPVFGRKAAEQKPELPKKQFPNLKFGSLKRFIPGANGNRPPISSPKEQYQAGMDHLDRSNNAGGLFIDSKYGVGQGQLQESHRDIQNRQQNTHFSHDNSFQRFSGKFNHPEQSSSDAEDDCPVPCNMSRGSGSFAGSGPRDEQWSPSSPGPPLPPPYGGMTSRSVASLNQMGSYPETACGNSTLSRRNTMMSGTLERNAGYGYPRVNYMQHSSSVCDLTNPMMPPPYMMGYRLPHVQSMADLQQGEMGPMPAPCAPCGCRPNWIGPDAFGQWHPPVACLSHSATSNAFAGNAKPQQPPYHQGFPTAEGMFGPVMYPMMAPSGSPMGYPPPSPIPPANPRGTSGNEEQRAASPVSVGSRKKSKEVRGQSRTSRRRTKPPMGTSSEEDYFSAGESDEEEPVEERRNKVPRQNKLANGSWECEHCTFVNKADTRICNVCCKTTGRERGEKRGNSKSSSASVDMEVDVAEELEVQPERVSGYRPSRIDEKRSKSTSKTPPKIDDGEYEDLDNGQTNTTKAVNEKEVFTKEFQNPQKNTLPKPKKVNSSVGTSAGPVRHGVEVATDPMEIEEDPVVNHVQMDTQTYSSVFKEKILPPSSSSKTNGNTINQKNVMSKGTSPPPQSIATQTPHADVWTPPEPQKPMGRTSSRMSLSGEPSEVIGGGGMGSYHPSSSVLKRAASLHFPRSYGGYNDGGNSWGMGYQGSSMVRSGSRSSLMSDNHFGYNLSGPPSRDSSPPPPIQRNIISRRESNIERGQLGYSSFAQEDRNTSRKDYYLSLEELVEKRRQETLRSQGLELVKLLREAEQQNFSADDLQVAMNHCGSQNPVQWLQDNWKNMIDTVVTLATNYGNDKKKNDIGVMSSSEAKECLRLHKGNIWAAVTECVEQRQKRFADLLSRGNFSRDEIVAALTSNQGNADLAFEELNKASLKPFLMRIWGPPSGVENESGITWAAMQEIRRERDADVAKDSWKKSLPLDDYEDTHLPSKIYDEDEVRLEEVQSVSNEGESSLEEVLDWVPDGDSLDNDAEFPEKSEAKEEEFFDAIPGTPTELESPMEFATEIPSPPHKDETPEDVYVEETPKESPEEETREEDPALSMLSSPPVFGNSSAEEENPEEETRDEDPTPSMLSSPPVFGNSSAEEENPEAETPEEECVLPALSSPPVSGQSSVILTSLASITLEQPSFSRTLSPSLYKLETAPNTSNTNVVSAMKIDLEQLVKPYQQSIAIPQTHTWNPPINKSSGMQSEAIPMPVLNTQAETLPVEETFTDLTEQVPPKELASVSNTTVSPLAVGIREEVVETTVNVTEVLATEEKIRQSPLKEVGVLQDKVNGAVADSKHTTNVESPKVTGRKESKPAKTRLKQTKIVETPTKAKAVVEDFEPDLNRRVRQFLAEGRLPTFEKAEVAVKLIDLRFDESEAIYAARECSDLYMAVSYLQQDCELCAGKFPMGKMVSMLNCIHRCCRNCAKDYFTLKIKERNIMEIVCPFCNEPNLNDDDVALDYFINLDIVLKNLIDEDTHELFQRKLRDRALMSDPNFLWCQKCSFGFMAEANRRRLVCPNCKVVTCAECKKQWEKQHDGISCQQFLEWKQDNDPEYQIAGLDKYLAENGIDCPKCKFKYALAKGGCMHFTCSQCKYEFCSGCGRPFRMAKKCGVSERCERLGLHAHHPRNCLFYLRDKEPKDLIKLLDDHGVSHTIEIQCSEEAEGQPRKCPVMEQKELPDGVEDSKCGRDVKADYPGLCRLHYIEYLGGVLFKNELDPIALLSDDDLEAVIRNGGRRLPPRFTHVKSEEYRLHYVEYLVSLINDNVLDPVTVMDVGALQQEISRKEKRCPEREEGELEELYRNKLVQMILNEIPLSEA